MRYPAWSICCDPLVFEVGAFQESVAVPLAPLTLDGALALARPGPGSIHPERSVTAINAPSALSVFFNATPPGPAVHHQPYIHPKEDRTRHKQSRRSATSGGAKRVPSELSRGSSGGY